MTDSERQVWSIEAFVRARREFDQGRGQAQTWDRLHRLSVERLRELARRDRAESWTLFIGLLTARMNVAQQATLVQTLRSMGYGHLRCRVHWRSAVDLVMASPAVVAPGVGAPLAETIAWRRQQLAVVQWITAPDELQVVNVATGDHLRVGTVDAQAVANALAKLFDAANVAVEYLPIGWFEGLAFRVAERRLRTTSPRP